MIALMQASDELEGFKVVLCRTDSGKFVVLTKNYNAFTHRWEELTVLTFSSHDEAKLVFLKAVERVLA